MPNQPHRVSERTINQLMLEEAALPDKRKKSDEHR
jgi:hypothetical protein